MLSLISFALLLPLSVFALPLGPFDKPSSISCVIADVSYPNPKHTLMLLNRRAVVPPLGLSERTFANLLVWCHEYGRSTSGVLLARQEPSCAAGAGGAAGDQSTQAPASAPYGGSDQDNTGAGSPTSRSSSTVQPTPATSTSGSNDAPTAQGSGAAPSTSGDSSSASPGSDSGSGTPAFPATNHGATGQAPAPAAVPAPATTSTDTGTSPLSATPKTTSLAATATNPPCPAGQIISVSDAISGNVVKGAICVSI
ncbi:hypothetical protein BS17DRAFT_783092 [Gyrodon lividus]|nr:hypothetical protein BS17DRAFT_783092 [Gyrodon lividus]